MNIQRTRIVLAVGRPLILTDRFSGLMVCLAPHIAGPGIRGPCALSDWDPWSTGHRFLPPGRPRPDIFRGFLVVSFLKLVVFLAGPATKPSSALPAARLPAAAADEEPQDRGDNDYPEDWVDHKAQDGGYDDNDDRYSDIY